MTSKAGTNNGETETATIELIHEEPSRLPCSTLFKIETRFDMRAVFRIINSVGAGVRTGLQKMKQALHFHCRSGESLGVEVGAFGFVFLQTFLTLSGYFLALHQPNARTVTA